MLPHWITKIIQGIFARKRDLIHRTARVELHPLTGITFNLSDRDGARGATFPLTNISTEGMGLARATGQEWAVVGAEIRGTIDLRGRRFPVACTIVHTSPLSVGCRFSFNKEAGELWTMVSDELAFEVAGGRLVEQRTARKTEPGGSTSRVFKDSGQNELFLLEKDGELQTFQLSFFGNYLEGGRGQEMRFGYLHGNAAGLVSEKPDASTVYLVSRIPNEVRDSALRFVSGVSALDAQLRESVLCFIRSV